MPILFLGAALLVRALAFGSASIDPDEGLYMVQAVAWLGGGWPYLAAWDMHPPGAPALLALVHAVIPEPVMAMRLAGVLAVAATGWGLHALARLLGAGPRTALAAGLLYVAHSVVQGGLATNTEILFAPFTVLTALLLLREALMARTPRAAVVFAAGLTAGIALLIKQVCAIECSVLWLTMAGMTFAAGRLTPPRAAGLALAFAAGAGMPSLGMAAGYWLAGTFDEWLRANILVLFAYTGAPGEWPGMRQGVLLALPHIGWLGLAALGLLAAESAARRRVLPLLPWLAAAALAVAAPWKFYDHYFLILLPPLSLLAAFGLAALARLVFRPRFRARGFAVAVALLVAMPVSDMLVPRLAHGAGLVGESPVRRVAELAKAALHPGEALYVANWHPITYVLAGQPPPTRFAFPGHLAGRFAPVTGIDADAELARVLALPPGVIVIAPALWPSTRPEAREAIETALAHDYDLFGTVPDGWGPVEVWRRR